MAGFDGLADKAKHLFEDQKVQKALHGKQAEGISDNLLDGLAGAADKATGGKHHDAVENARDRADKSVGDR